MKRTATANLRLPALWLAAAFLLYFLGCGGGGGGTGGAFTGGADTYQVSGTVQASTGATADGDVNDPNAPYFPNNTFDTAQTIDNPTTVGGYANVAGTGSSGRSYANGDPVDIYKVSLSAGEQVLLTISGAAAGDLDLFLYDQNRSLLEGSEGITDTEVVTAPSDGFYYVEVYAAGGATTYLLTTGLTGIAVAGTLRLSDDFVPGEVIVKLKDSPNGLARRSSAAAVAQSVGLQAKAGAPEREMLLSLPSATRPDAIPALGTSAPSASLQKSYAALSPDDQRKWDTLETVKALRKRTDVLFAEPNYIRQPSTVPNDSYYRYQWHYPLINLPQAWEISKGSASVIVAVVDTGILGSHPDLIGKWVAGYDFISDAGRARDGTGIDPDPEDPGDSGSNTSSFHGTHVSGTVSAATNNAKGVAGVAWNVKVMPVRVMGLGGGTEYDIIQGVRYAAGLSNDSNTVPAQKADVINLSLGGPSYSTSELNAMTAARNAGVIVVAAAGNDNSSSPSYPAAYSGVVSVSAVGPLENRAPYSNYGTTIDVAAPGGDMTKDLDNDGYLDGVLSTGGNDSTGSVEYVYKFAQGTSMASPHVAAVAALMKSVYPDLTPEIFDQLLAGGYLTRDIGPVNRDDSYGYGLIDAQKAAAKAKALNDAGASTTPVLEVSPIVLNFGPFSTSTTVTAANVGVGSLSLSSVAVVPPEATWLTVSEAAVDADKLGDYTVSVSRTGLAEGGYSAVVRFTPSTGDPVNLAVAMRVTAAPPAYPDAGYQYVLLVNPDTAKVVAEVRRQPVNGSYSFTFTGVPEGTYQLWTGSDSNNNRLICEEGEACGAYPDADHPASVTVTGNKATLNFDAFYPNDPLVTGLATAGAVPLRPIERPLSP